MRGEAQRAAARLRAAAIANTAWAFAVTDARHPQFIAALTERLAQPGLALNASLVQLQQFSLWCELELRLPEAQLLPPPLRERCRDALRAIASGTEEEHATQKHAYRLEKSVGRALGRLGLSPTAEHVLAEGYSVDYALVDERIAIEVDGPSHFALSGDGAGRRPVGKTVIKRRLLAALGWRLLEVPFWEWDPLGSKNSERGVWRLRGAVRVPARAAAAAARRRRLVAA